MANPTTNFGWQMPQNTDLVKDLPADFEVFGQAVDTSLMDLKGGTTGQVLSKASNTDMDFTWSSVDPLTILDAKGDLISATAADTPARLASSGVNGDVLTVDTSTSTGLKWAAPASGGMTLISSTTLSGASVVLSSIPSTYVDLYLLIFGVTGNTNNRTIRVRPNGSTSSASYSGVISGLISNNENVSIDLANQGTMTRTDSDNSFAIRIFNYASTTGRKPFDLIQRFVSSSTTYSGGAFGILNDTTAISSITIDRGGTDTFAGGTLLFYGVK